MSSNGGMQGTRWTGRLGLVAAGLGLMLAAQVARAQGGCTFTDDNGKTVFWPNCQDPSVKAPEGKAAGAKGSAPAPNAQTPAPGASPAQSFPFPGETPAAPVVRPNAAQGQAGSGAAGDAPAASRFPFPGQDSGGTKPAAGSSSSGPMQDAGSSGSNSGNSSGSSSSSSDDGGNPAAGPLGDGDTDPAAEAAAARRAARLRHEHDATNYRQTPDQRESEDLRVAAFYQNDGNFRGAYDRATDAVSLAADDAEAHLALAEAARRLGKLDEAETHYRKCLTLDPVPKVRKAAERALKEMTAGG